MSKMEICGVKLRKIFFAVSTFRLADPVPEAAYAQMNRNPEVMVK